MCLPVELAGLSALIVDDNSTNRRLLMQILKRWGMQSYPAENAAQALLMANEAHGKGQAFDVLLLDAMMPEMDGFELAKKLQLTPEIARGAVMMLSSTGHRGDAQRCKSLGISSYLTKPVDSGELMNAIKMALGAQAAVASTVGRDNRQPQRSMSILLAEDNLVNQKLAVALLEKWGHTVVLANNGKEAIEQCGLQDFDLILMDMQMPEMGGLEATQLIRAHEASLGKHTTIVAMTANAMAEDRQRCLDVGMDDYLSKPLNTDKLRAVLQGLATIEEAALKQDMMAVAEFDYVAALAGVDEWVIETIGQAFLDEAEPHMVEMDKAIREGNNVVLRRSAHTLRGLVGNFNARRIEALAGQIEQRAESEVVFEVFDLYDKLKIEMSRFEVALTDSLARLSGA